MVLQLYWTLYFDERSLSWNVFILGPSNNASEDVTKAWDIMDIMNNVTTVHNCAEHKNQKCGIGNAFDSLNREKWVVIPFCILIKGS